MHMFTSFSLFEIAEGFRESFLEGLSMMAMDVLYGISCALSVLDDAGAAIRAMMKG